MTRYVLRPGEPFEARQVTAENLEEIAEWGQLVTEYLEVGDWVWRTNYTMSDADFQATYRPESAIEITELTKLEGRHADLIRGLRGLIASGGHVSSSEYVPHLLQVKWILDAHEQEQNE